MDGAGRPQNFGWSRQPDFLYESPAIWTQARKISSVDRYIVFSPSHTVVFELRDDGYLGRASVTVASQKDKKRSTHAARSLFPFGSCGLPPGSKSGAARFRKKGAALDFVPMEGGARIIRADFLGHGSARSIRGELVLSEPASPGGAAESIACNLPWPNDKSAFECFRCSPWYTAEGIVQLGTMEIVFSRGNSWGIFDWSRGSRPRSDARHWASACGIASDSAGASRLVGFCVGHGTEDGSSGTKSAFFVDGRLHKLDQITFHAPRADQPSLWRFTASDSRLEMAFAPHQERADRQRVLFRSFSRRQLFGKFSGKAVLDDGSEIDFANISGIAERVKTRF